MSVLPIILYHLVQFFFQPFLHVYYQGLPHTHKGTDSLFISPHLCGLPTIFEMPCILPLPASVPSVIYLFIATWCVQRLMLLSLLNSSMLFFVIMPHKFYLYLCLFWAIPLQTISHSMGLPSSLVLGARSLPSSDNHSLYFPLEHSGVHHRWTQSGFTRTYSLKTWYSSGVWWVPIYLMYE